MLGSFVCVAEGSSSLSGFIVIGAIEVLDFCGLKNGRIQAWPFSVLRRRQCRLVGTAQRSGDGSPGKDLGDGEEQSRPRDPRGPRLWGNRGSGDYEDCGSDVSALCG